MIVAMKKVCCISQEKDALETLSQLRSLGLVHVEHQQPPQGKDISLLQEDISLAALSLDILERYRPDRSKVTQKESSDWKVCSHHVVDLEKRIEHLKDYSQKLKIKISDWERWGDFDPHLIEELSRREIFIRFCQIPGNEVASLGPEIIVKKIFVSAGTAHCMVISRGAKEIPYKEVPAPKLSLSGMRAKLAEDQLVIKNLEKDIHRHADHFNQINLQLGILEKQLRFSQALRGMGQDSGFIYLVGYCPVESCGILEDAACKKQWALSISDPSEEDNVPTFIRNPRWVTLIKPVLALLGIIPGYRELDVSPMFLIFFSLFFGILIGDAGYGLAYFGLTFFMQKKMGKNPASKNVFTLFYLLSSSAIIWGVLTGTFFGQGWLAKTGFKPLVPFLNDMKFMENFCFFLGAFHLSIAHFWKTIVKLPSLSALAEIGWICVLWAAFFLARTLILAEPFPSWGMWLVYLGVGMVILFTNPQRNMFKAIGEGLGAVALSLMNNFTDVVSYVRLAAVGMAGLAIAETTNGMGAGLSGGIATVAAIFILVFGHALNIVLGPMSVLVHGVRLNVLEFSGHAGLTWSGVAYEPLKE
jgi:V/A-type H+/Na+-transporting ATPase subunit I